MYATTWLDRFFAAYKAEIMNEWFHLLGSKVGPQYQTETVWKNGEVYYDLIAANYDSPLQSHPKYDILPVMTEYHYKHNTPPAHLFKSTHIWREGILSVLHRYVGEQGSYRLYFDGAQRIHTRIDEIQDMIFQLYAQLGKQELQHKQRVIDTYRQSKLENLGKLAASIAHELRNPLFAIEGLLTLVKLELQPEPNTKAAMYLEVIEGEYKGLYRHISALLSFSQNMVEEEPKSLHDVRKVIESVIELCSSRMIDENIQVKIEGPSHTVRAALYYTSTQQAFLNLIFNSLDALYRKNGDKRIRFIIQEGKDSVTVTISDNGEGIPDGLGENLFSPFVTSKANCTGLGLPICKQIMEKHGGTIRYSSGLEDTSFTLTFPKCGQAGETH